MCFHNGGVRQRVDFLKSRKPELACVGKLIGLDLLAHSQCQSVLLANDSQSVLALSPSGTHDQILVKAESLLLCD
jgi:hypothetical protein